MALSAAYLAVLKEGDFKLSEILEVGLDSGAVYFGTHQPAIAERVTAMVETMSSLSNKLDTKEGWGTRGTMTFTIGGRDNIKSLVANNYLKNRRVTRKQGFLASGFAYADYYPAFTGKITDWKRDGGKLTVTVMDDSYDTKKKIPVQNATKTQYIDYTNSNILDVASDMLLTQLGIPSGLVDSAKFTSERDTWLPSFKVSRVITEPKEAKEYLNELQVEGNFFIISTGAKISCKAFAPPLPTETVEEWTDDLHIINGSFKLDSGYTDNFYNSVEVLFDYDESGSDGEANFEAVVISNDTSSQSSAQYDEVKVKTIKSKWIKSFTFSHTSLAGLKPYHVSRNNGAGAGTITYTYDAGGDHTMTWTAPGGTAGEAVKVTKDGKFDIYDADKTKYCRVLIAYASLPSTSGSCTVTISALQGEQQAGMIANKLLSRFRDPAAIATFEVGLNQAVYGSEFVKPTDLKNITTGEGFEFGEQSWAQEPCMVTMVRPKGKTVEVECVETKQYRQYIFIAPAGYPDAPSATAEQKKRWFIGDTNNKINGGTEDGRYIW